MSQLNYGSNIAPAQAGMLADSGFTDKVTGLAAVDVTVGCLLVQGTGDGIVRPPAAAADITGSFRKGIVIKAQVNEQPFPAGTALPVVPAKKAISMLRKGRIWVTVEEAVTTGVDVPFVRYASGAGGTVLGNFRKSADTATAVALPGARFLSSTTGAGLALVEVDL